MKLCAVVLVLVAGGALVACASRGARADIAANVENFQDYPLVWLGPAYDVDSDGKPDTITMARTASSPPLTNPMNGEVLVPAKRTYTIAYGTCDIPAGADGCAVPLALVFSAACDTVPLSEIAKSRMARVRGVDAIVETSGSLRLETADFTLTIHAPGSTAEEVTQNAIRIANDLQPANAKARAALALAPAGGFRPKGDAPCVGVSPGPGVGD